MEMKMPAPEWLTLCWNGKPLGRITEIGWVDFPWAGGRFAPDQWPADLRLAIEWFSRGQETCAGPPFADMDRFCDGWTVLDPQGKVREIGPPVVDFVAGDIEWR